VVLRDRGFALALRDRLDRLIAERCRRVRLPVPGPLRSAWIALRSLVVLHVMRRHPVWARRWPAQAPRVAPLRADSS
jgi:cardiolipin synthase